MSEEVIKVLDDLSARLGVAIDWGSEKALPALQVLYGRFLDYRLTVHCIWIAISLVLIIACIHGIFSITGDYERCKRLERDGTYWIYSRSTREVDNSCFGMTAVIALIIAFPVSVGIFLTQAHSLIELLMMPELYVMDFLMNYVN